MKELLEKLYKTNNLTKEELVFILDNIDEYSKSYLFQLALKTLDKTYGKRLFVRGLLEFTNYCKNNCMYCGIRRDNRNVERYRLSQDEIIMSLDEGYRLGYKTFVLQGGEDPYFTDEILVNLISKIKNRYSNVALTLSIGERSFESYEKFYIAGVDRFLLRHEVATPSIYENLHPGTSFQNRVSCLKNLKKIGYQSGAGFIVGLPGETNEVLAENLQFLKQLEPAMVGIGPFIPHPDTPLSDKTVGSVDKTIILLAFIRLLLPDVLLPATTALNTLCANGLERGLQAGANVVMLNLSPIYVREKYEIYKDKDSRDIHELKTVEKKASIVGFRVDMGRGDNINFGRV